MPVRGFGPVVEKLAGMSQAEPISRGRGTGGADEVQRVELSSGLLQHPGQIVHPDRVLETKEPAFEGDGPVLALLLEDGMAGRHAGTALPSRALRALRAPQGDEDFPLRRLPEGARYHGRADNSLGPGREFLDQRASD